MFKVVKLVNNPDVIDCGTVDEFLQTNFLPYVRSLYDVTVKVHTSIDEVVKLLLQAIQTKNYDEDKVCVLLLSYFSRGVYH
jgi:hypothetical protein